MVVLMLQCCCFEYLDSKKDADIQVLPLPVCLFSSSFELVAYLYNQAAQPLLLSHQALKESLYQLR